MSRRDPQSLTDGFTGISLGVNSGLEPVALPRTQMSWAINATFRNGFAQPRPGFAKLPLTFLDENGDENLSLKNHFETLIYQGAQTFERRNQLVMSVGGRLYAIDLATYNVSDISTIDFNPRYRERIWGVEDEDWVQIQDGQSAPWIYDGATTVRSDTFGINGAKQTPTGTAMVYSNGRVLVALPDNHQFVVGDIVGGSSGTLSYQFRDAVLYFTENDLLNGGGAFSVPINAGNLTAFRPIAQVDTSTGQGPTQVFTTGGIFSLNAPTDRTTWATTNFPIGTVSMVSSGSLSDRATVNVNGDLWMRSLDGIRSFLVARRNFTTWVNAPMSQEMVRALATDDKSLLSFASAALFDNRLLVTANPYRIWNHGIAHRGLAVLDFAPVAYLSDRTPPAWEGIWTGLQVLQIMSGTFGGIERCFVAAMNAEFRIELWELTRAAVDDFTGTTSSRIVWQLESGAFTFPRTPDAGPGQYLVSLDGGRLYVDNLQGTVDFTAEFRTDQSPCWNAWHSWSVCATQAACFTGEGCVTPPNNRPQYRKPFFLPNPQETCDAAVNKYAKTLRETQVRLTFTGQVRVKRFEAIAHDLQEDITGLCAPDEECESVSCCRNDWQLYIIPGEHDGTGRVADRLPPTPVGQPTPVQNKSGTPIEVHPTVGTVPPPTSVGPPVPKPPLPPYTPPVMDTGIPIVCSDNLADTCWTKQYSAIYVSNFGFTKVTDNPSVDGMTAPLLAFWQELLFNEYAAIGVNLPTNGTWAWSYVDSVSGYVGDVAARFAIPDSHGGDSNPVYAPFNYWRLAYLTP